MFDSTLEKLQWGQCRLNQCVSSRILCLQTNQPKLFLCRRQTAASGLPGVYSVNNLHLGHADKGQLPLTLHSYALLTAITRQWLTARETHKMSHLCRKGHVGMQFNPHVTILKIRGWSIIRPMAFAGGHASPDPTPSHNTDVFSYPCRQTSWLVSQPKSLHIKSCQQLSHNGHIVLHTGSQGQCLQVYCILKGVL